MFKVERRYFTLNDSHGETTNRDRGGPIKGIVWAGFKANTGGSVDKRIELSSRELGEIQTPGHGDPPQSLGAREISRSADKKKISIPFRLPVDEVDRDAGGDIPPARFSRRASAESDGGRSSWRHAFLSGGGCSKSSRALLNDTSASLPGILTSFNLIPHI